MRERSRIRTIVEVVALMFAGLLLSSLTTAQAGKNAKGALIVHTNDAVSYTGTGNYCGVNFNHPGTCEQAGTRTDKAEDEPAVIWFLAAFPDTSSPAVTVVYFGIDHNLPSEEGYFQARGFCAPSHSLEVPDPGWPEHPEAAGNSVASPTAWLVQAGNLFPFYWFAAYGFEGAYLGTAINPVGGYACFVDDGNPGVMDEVTRFGKVRWYAAGSNACPSGGGDGTEGQEGETEGNGTDDPTGEPDLPDHGEPLAYIRLAADSPAALLSDARVLEGQYGFRSLSILAPDAIISRVSPELIQRLSLDERVRIATNDSIPGLPPLLGAPGDPIDTRYVWNRMLGDLEGPGGGLPDSSLHTSPDPALYVPPGNPIRQTSVFMMGLVGVQMIYLESIDDRRCNPDSSIYTENWTLQQQRDVLTITSEALRRAFADGDPDRDLSFFFPQVKTVFLDTEPIRRRMAEPSMMDSVYMALGYYSTGLWLDRGFEYNNDLRAEFGTDWFFTVFVVKDECDEDHQFASGQIAGGWMYGPCEMSTWFHAGWLLIAHETAHVFGASDEYQGSNHCNEVPEDCAEEWGYLHVPNSNCCLCSPYEHVPCLMHMSWDPQGQHPLCEWTRGQLGWWDTDQDGPFDPIDHPASGRTALLWDPVDTLAVGDLIVVRDTLGAFVKTIAVSRWNCDGGRVVWDGMDYAGYEAPTGPYRWWKNGAEMGRVEIKRDYLAPTMSNVLVNVTPGVPSLVALSFEFEDTDTQGCRMRVDTRPTGGQVPPTRRVSDTFKFHTIGGSPVDTTFAIWTTGFHDLELLIWDVGGGHNATETVSFWAGPPADVGRDVALRQIVLRSGSPNPSSDWIRWRLEGSGADPISIRVIAADGRTVRDWASRPIPPEGMTILWDGRDNANRQVAAGRYWLVVGSRDGRRIAKSAAIVR